MNINELLSDYFCKTYHITDGIYNIEIINAKELFVSERIDLIAKYKYIEHREKGYSLSYAKELYSAHIEAFSSGKFTEPGQEDTKNSISSYLHTFDKMIDNIKTNGFDSSVSVVPVGKNNIILDGSHRTAIAAYYDIPLPIICFNDIVGASYGTQFFAGQFLNSDYLDDMVTEFCKLKNNVYVAILWPKIFTKGEAKTFNKIIEDACKVIYQKKIHLSFDGLIGLMTQVYHQEEWLGSIDNHFQGAKNKALECYDTNEKLIIYILESPDVNNIFKLKQEIRAITGIANSAIHTTDDPVETIRLCKMLLNKNTIDLLKFGKLYAFPKAHRLLDQFKKNMHHNNLNSDEFIVDSSCILGLYGLRDIRDLDFLSISESYVFAEGDMINSHHNELQYHNTTIEELLFAPNNYLVYNGIKLITLEALRIMKKRRNEPKDITDIVLINRFIRTHNGIRQIASAFIQRKKPTVIRKYRSFRSSLRSWIIKISKASGVYPLTRWLYRKIKRRGS